MKKLATFVMGWALIAGAAFAADTNTATSVNIVGFNKITCPKGKYVLVSTAFESLTNGVLKCSDVLGDQVPVSTTVSYFDAKAIPPQYVTDTKTTRGWGTQISFAGYMGFWINVPAESPLDSYDVILSGQVPMSLTSSNAVVSGYNLCGYPYTASVLWTNTSMAINAQVGDVLHVYDPVSGYTPYTLTSRGWGDAKTLMITPGMGFWFQSSTSFTNVESRPYNP